jgi:hypothetical protein
MFVGKEKEKEKKKKECGSYKMKIVIRKVK